LCVLAARGKYSKNRRYASIKTPALAGEKSVLSPFLLIDMVQNKYMLVLMKNNTKEKDTN
jgi:hypothetical protein